MPKHVARMVGFFVEAVRGMAVEDRAAEGHVFSTIAIASDGEMAARHYHLEFARAGSPEEGDVLLGAPRLAAGVILELLFKLADPLRVEQRLEGIVRKGLLFL